MPIANLGFAESRAFGVAQGCSSPLLFREDHTAGAALSGLPGWLSFLTLGATYPLSPAPLNSPSCARRCRAAPQFSASTLFSPVASSLHDRPSGSQSLGPVNPEVLPIAAPTSGPACSTSTPQRTIRSPKVSTQMSPAETAPMGIRNPKQLRNLETTSQQSRRSLSMGFEDRNAEKGDVAQA